MLRTIVYSPNIVCYTNFSHPCAYICLSLYLFVYVTYCICFIFPCILLYVSNSQTYLFVQSNELYRLYVQIIIVHIYVMLYNVFISFYFCINIIVYKYKIVCANFIVIEFVHAYFSFTYQNKFILMYNFYLISCAVY